jgi:hypothetical protein
VIELPLRSPAGKLPDSRAGPGATPPDIGCAVTGNVGFVFEKIIWTHHA